MTCSSEPDSIVDLVLFYLWQTLVRVWSIGLEARRRGWNTCWCWQKSRHFVCVMLHVSKCTLILTYLFQLKYSYIMIIFSFTIKVHVSLTKFVFNFRYKHCIFCLIYLFLTISYNSVTRSATQELCNLNQITSLDSEIKIKQAEMHFEGTKVM
jgi:hypothetical protein